MMSALKRNNTAQTAIELSVFGAILIFVMGSVVRSGLSFGLIQNQSLRAMRLAMVTSHRYSDGHVNIGKVQKHGVSSRNTAAVLIIEDRLTANSDRYGAIDRQPFINASSATHSRNLFMPTDPGEDFQLPHYDMFINGKHFPFSVSGFKEVKVSDLKDAQGNSTRKVYERIPNHPGFPEFCFVDPCPGTSADERFDLDHDGTTDVTDPIERELFAWQWQAVDISDIDESSVVDLDGDLKEERVLKVSAGKFILIDSQEGDMDFSVNNNQPEQPPGIENDVYMFTRTSSGTYLQIDEGELFEANKQYVRTASKKDHVDLIQRVIRLSNDTGRFCKNGAPNTDPKYWPPPSGKLIGIKNPIEVCGQCNSVANQEKTCMETTGSQPIIYVRSRIYEGFGHKWVTDESQDPYVDLRRN